MKIRNHFTIDSTALAVLVICLVGVVAVLVSVFWNIESPNLKVAVLFIGLNALILNRILPATDKIDWVRLRNLRLITESLFAIGLVGLIVSWVFYDKWFNFFAVLIAPSFILAVYLLINYGFKTND
jgi:uncharacterized membrane protein